MGRRVALFAIALAVTSAAVLAYVGLGSRGDSAPQTTAMQDAPAGHGGHAGHAMPASEEETTPRARVAIDARRRQLTGVRTARAERRRTAAAVRATGTIAFDETREYEINAKIGGWITELNANFTGMDVQEGDPLFTIYSPELLAAENELILAVRGQQHAQIATLPETRDHAEQLVQAVRERLEFWDISVAEIRQMERRARGYGTTTIVSPATGLIVEKDVVEGMQIEAGQRLFRVADLSAVWVEADVYERDLGLVREGQSATVTLDAYPGEEFRGRVAYLHPSVAQQTRTLKVRLHFDNPRGRLRPGMFANVTIAGPGTMRLTVPADAVIDSGTEQIVFVAQGDGYFDPRRVKTGRRLDDAIEILEGLEEGDTVAAGATFFVDSESQLRGALQNYRMPAGAPAAAAAAPGLDITLQSQPDPPRAGTTTFEVMVRDAQGRPVNDADVSVGLFMPAMPAMNMPAMRSDATLTPAGEGTYRGPATVSMAGRWDVTVTVARDGQTLGTRQLAIVAR